MTLLWTQNKQKMKFSRWLVSSWQIVDQVGTTSPSTSSLFFSNAFHNTGRRHYNGTKRREEMLIIWAAKMEYLCTCDLLILLSGTKQRLCGLPLKHFSHYKTVPFAPCWSCRYMACWQLLATYCESDHTSSYSAVRKSTTAARKFALIAGGAKVRIAEQ